MKSEVALMLGKSELFRKDFVPTERQVDFGPGHITADAVIVFDGKSSSRMEFGRTVSSVGGKFSVVFSS